MQIRRATKAAATWLGILAGVAGLEHGYFEYIQGSVPPPSFVFPSMGPPCVPAQAWHACEPALTVLPNLRVAGLLTVILGLVIILWSLLFIQNKYGGHVLILLSILLLLAGGGVFPPLFGIISGAAATQINKPVTKKPSSRIQRSAARAWPWPLIILITWLAGQYLVGYLSNDFMKSIMVFGLPLIIILLPVSVYCAYAEDVVQGAL